MKEPNIFIIGDPHFWHKNIINYCNRPFETVEEMNETLIKNWNKVVGKQDIVYVLGDFALCGKDRIIEVSRALNGRKRLILGNHDGASLDTYREAGFEYIYNHSIILDEFYILSHYPQTYIQKERCLVCVDTLPLTLCGYPISPPKLQMDEYISP